MHDSCLEKQKQIKEELAKCRSSEHLYQNVMEMGRKLASYDPSWKTQDHLVPGCQSTMYLHAQLVQDCIFFSASSDALISAGLAALLLSVYNGEKPETILKCEPKFLEGTGLFSALTPGRANGLTSLYLKMKQEALACLVQLK